MCSFPCVFICLAFFANTCLVSIIINIVQRILAFICMEMSEKHVLQDCPGYCALTRKYWPTAVTLNHKLYGNRD